MNLYGHMVSEGAVSGEDRSRAGIYFERAARLGLECASESLKEWLDDNRRRVSGQRVPLPA